MRALIDFVGCLEGKLFSNSYSAPYLHPFDQARALEDMVTTIFDNLTAARKELAHSKVTALVLEAFQTGFVPIPCNQFDLKEGEYFYRLYLVPPLPDTGVLQMECFRGCGDNQFELVYSLDSISSWEARVFDAWHKEHPGDYNVDPNWKWPVLERIGDNRYGPCACCARPKCPILYAPEH